MAKPYLIFKAHTGIYYAQIRLADGSLSINKSTGYRKRAEAERTVMQWIVTDNVPVRVNSKDNKVQSIDKIKLFNDLRTADFDNDDINTIIKILTERNYLYSAVPKSLKGSIPIENFLENFWDYDKSPYVREMLGKRQSIHRQYCSTLLSRTRLYWIPRLAGKCVAEITIKDVDAFFSSDEAQKLAPKTVNSIIETITIPRKWAYYNELTIHIEMLAGEIEVSVETSSNTGKGINQDSFKLGVLFVLSELEKGRKKGQILKDKRIAKMELGELNLSDEDAARISQRFGIA